MRCNVLSCFPIIRVIEFVLVFSVFSSLGSFGRQHTESIADTRCAASNPGTGYWIKAEPPIVACGKLMPLLRSNHQYVEEGPACTQRGRGAHMMSQIVRESPTISTTTTTEWRVRLMS